MTSPICQSLLCPQQRAVTADVLARFPRRIRDSFRSLVEIMPSLSDRVEDFLCNTGTVMPDHLPYVIAIHGIFNVHQSTRNSPELLEREFGLLLSFEVVVGERRNGSGRAGLYSASLNAANHRSG